VRADTGLELLVPPGMSGATAKGLAHFTGLPLRGRSRRVVGFKLDTLVLDLLRLGRVDVIKIDAEGAGVEVLEGALEVLRRFRPKLLIEVRRSTYPRVMRILGGLGYVVEELDGSNIAAV